MTKVKEKTMTMTDEFIDEAEAQFGDWLDYLNRLQDTIKDAGGDIEQSYSKKIADLRMALGGIEEQLEDLKSSDPEQWEERKYRFQKSAWAYQQSYVRLVSDMKAYEHKPAGWLEGFTEQPPAGSAGWLEGTDAQPTGSEGWVEGMAERSPESEGWKEGYNTN